MSRSEAFLLTDACSAAVVVSSAGAFWPSAASSRCVTHSTAPGRSRRAGRRRRERLLLWLPVIGKHVITPESPIASWATPAGLMSDADAAIVLVVRPRPGRLLLSQHRARPATRFSAPCALASLPARRTFSGKGRAC